MLHVEYYEIESTIPLPLDVELPEPQIERLIEHPVRKFQQLVELSNN